MKEILAILTVFIFLYFIVGWFVPFGHPLRRIFSKKNDSIVYNTLWGFLTIYYIETNSATWIVVAAYLINIINLYYWFKYQANDWKTY